MSESTSLQGRAVVITGGGTGIGRAAAHQFAAAGADVLVTGRTEATLKETTDGTDVRFVVADVATAEGRTAIVDAAVREFGRIDVLVNNAAITRPADLGEIDPEAAERQFATNLAGPLFLTQSALPHIGTGGTIINVTSNSPHRGWPGSSVYGATKVAMDFLTKTWALELADRGVRVVSIAPGITRTPILTNAGLTPEQVDSALQYLSRIPLARAAEPDEIAWWLVAVARPEAGYLTGQVIRVDGGLSAV
ncbi:SDR family NAD(P)-dependent oxidoreductase [Nocardia arthritidis]|uniref:SDR family oxidoreductase n=1 Tax=Nocardia arthritidis TaxID=228602 RepID=A0A6G9YH60_9NOCA|nr:SDR family oxidoreductase [Nocardia arthritidis]QIS12397.1 SDR family oxidoreductase [Nocardia arthritidis]